MQVLLHVVLYKQDEHILSAHSRSFSLKEKPPILQVKNMFTDLRNTTSYVKKPFVAP